MVAMALSEMGIKFIKSYEGKIMRNGLHVMYDDHTGKPISRYEDAKGFPTIGYGHLITESEKAKNLYLNGITEEEANALFKQEIAVFERNILRVVTVELTQHEFDALVSFSFNVGTGNFNGSTLLKLLNQNKKKEAAEQFTRWIRSKGVILPGLVRRREAERDLFLHGVYIFLQ